MGSKKRNAAKSNSVQNSGKVTPPKSSPVSNGVKQKPSGTKHAKTKKSERGALSGTRWVVIILISSVVASVAVYYASPEVQEAVNNLIVRYSKIDILEEFESQDGVSKDSVNIGETENSQDNSSGNKLDSETKTARSVQDDPSSKQESLSQDGPQQQAEKQDGRQTPEVQAEMSHDSKPHEKSDGKSHEKSGESSNKPVEQFEESNDKADKTDNKIAEEKEHSKGETERDDERKEEQMEDSNVPARGSSKMERQKEESLYYKSDITNTADYKIRKQLDAIDAMLDQNRIEDALGKYTTVLERHPKSPRALYGRAMALDKLSEARRSNDVLEMCLDAFKKLLEQEDIPNKLYKKAGQRLADRQQFRGYNLQSSRTYQLLVKKFPTDVDLMNQLGVSYLLIGHDREAKNIFRKVLKVHAQDGFAMVHLGFILKTSDNNPVEAVPFLEQGIKSRAEGTKDGRFYYHLGDALQRLGNNEKAYKYFKEAASMGMFLSAYQRSLYNVDRLRSHPWWTDRETGHSRDLKILKDHWQEIRDEALAQMNKKSGLFLPEDENLRETGDWKQFTLFQQGRKNKKSCEKTPLTCSLVEKIPAASSCTRGQVKFSVMQPGVHVWPHCGPTNCRIRAHLGLIVPEGPKIRVVNETKTWKEGDFIIFDDSFEHEVWHDGTEQRLVLIVDLWHPGLTPEEKRSLPPI